ncbi:MAG: patatin-like phospholipase family protein [Lachnospiraceae bacterium]|nr:patatin-like phospholipase family protein [Lachnospiraceae bacterium]
MAFDKEKIYDQSLLDKVYGLVLAGGGGKGAYQAGVFKALWECGMFERILGIAGSSVGALNMCLFSLEDVELSEEIWKQICPDQFIRPDMKYLDFNEGIFGREGLLELMDQYIDYERISESDMALYATVSRYDERGMGIPAAEYFRLNGMDKNMIQDTLLASSALPAIYAPVKIGEFLYRDGGITDNLPIEPLYRKGMRNFIVIPLSPVTEIPYEAYPNADFLIIKPSRSLGDDFTGTLDFTGYGAKIRMKLGYEDAVRTLTYLHSPESRQPEFEERMSALADEDFHKIILEYGTKQVEKLMKKDLKKIKNYLKTVTGA